jgi:hypothetical protein
MVVGEINVKLTRKIIRLKKDNEKAKKDNQIS